jgi:hypothetical protein
MTKKLDLLKQENRALKDEIANLTEAIHAVEERAVSVAQQESQMLRTAGWQASEREIAESDRARFEELAIRLARMYERIDQASSNGSSTDSDLMLRLVQCTQERCKVERHLLRLQRQMLDTSQADDLQNLSQETQVRDLENALDSIIVEERQLEGHILQRAHSLLLERLHAVQNNSSSTIEQMETQTMTVEHLVKESHMLRSLMYERDSKIRELEAELS